MQIKIDIEVKPEELRRFLGLPDVAGLQEDILHFLRGKVGAASENFDPASFVKENLQTLRNSPAWRRLFTLARLGATAESAAAVPPKPRRAAGAKRRRTASRRAQAPRGRAGAAAPAAPAAQRETEPAA